jgi:hypothetical protein
MNLKEFFDKNREKLDIFEPKTGHNERFLEKLTQNQNQKKKTISLSKKWMIAASFFVLFTAGLRYVFQAGKQKPVEIKQTEQYFSMLIQEELKTINYKETKETEKVFNDAMRQIHLLENDYSKLIKAYQINKDKYIINAMIENFQQRIEILQFVKKQIEQINKTRNYEKQRA